MKNQNWIVKFINKVDVPWGLSKEQLEELRKEVEQLTSENFNLTAENDALKTDRDNLTRTLEEANEELSALNSENLKITALFKAGYRKQSDTAREFAEMLKSEMKGLTTVIKEIDKIAASFGKEEKE